MNSLKFLRGGLLTTIQDMGRYGYQNIGIPPAGAMDDYALQMSNILAGNNRNEAAIETTYIGPVIEFKSPATFAITGADVSPSLQGNKVGMYRTIYANKGDVLELQPARTGFRSYISVTGGLDVSFVMGSKSTYLRGKIGGFEGRKIVDGDEIPIKSISGNIMLGIREIPGNEMPLYSDNAVIRVIMGPEKESFTSEGIQVFFGSEYTVSNQADRMGYRLEGPKVTHLAGADIISSAISLGVVQIPPHGQPIIMMADRQTIGGYTRVANTISVDIPLLAQLKPGDRIRFEETTLEKAHYLLRRREEELAGLENHFMRKSLELASKANHYLVKINGKLYSAAVTEI